MGFLTKVQLGAMRGWAKRRVAAVTLPSAHVHEEERARSDQEVHAAVGTGASAACAARAASAGGAASADGTGAAAGGSGCALAVMPPALPAAVKAGGAAAGAGDNAGMHVGGCPTHSGTAPHTMAPQSVGGGEGASHAVAAQRCATAPRREKKKQKQDPVQHKERSSQANDAATRCPSMRRGTSSHAAPQQQRAVGTSEDDGAASPRCEGEGTKSNERRKCAEFLAESGHKVVGVYWSIRQRRWIVRIPKGHRAQKHLDSFVKKADAIERRLRYDDERERARAGNQTQTAVQRKQRPSETSGATTRRPNKRRRTSTSPPSKQQQGAGSSRHDGANATDSEDEGASCSELRKRAELLADTAQRVPGVYWQARSSRWQVYALRGVHGKQIYLGSFPTQADAIESLLQYEGRAKGTQTQIPAPPTQRPSVASGAATRRPNKRRRTSTSPPSKQQQGAGRSRRDGANATDSEDEGASCSEIRKRAELLAAAKGAKGKRAPRVPGVSWHSPVK